MLWKRLSLAQKLFAAISVTTTLIVVAMALSIAWNMRDGFARYLVQAEINRLDDLVEALAAGHDPQNPGWHDRVSDPRAWRDFVEMHLPSDSGPGHLPGPPSGPIGSGPPTFLDRISLLDAKGNTVFGAPGHSGVFVKRPIRIGGPEDTSSPPLGWVGLDVPVRPETSAEGLYLSEQFRSLVIISALAVALSAIAALALARQVLAPLKALSLRFDTLAEGDYSARITHDRQDELGKLMDHYNALAEALEASARAERQWVSDTSHELQTPLAVLRAEIEAVQDGVREPTPEVLEGLHAAVMRLSHLVGDLKVLSQVREGACMAATQPADLREILDEAIDHARPRIEDAGLRLTVDADEHLPILCDPSRIQQLIDNLLENARRYTAAPGTILVKARRDGEVLTLTVEDTPPAPAPNAMAHLFERFYRAESSRSREHGGSGLGLAICRAIAMAHDGVIEAHQSDMGGLMVSVVLPAAPLP